MNLIFGNNIILTPIRSIIEQLKVESKWDFFHDIYDKGEYLRVTCPYHKNGQERHPSCSIYTSTSNENIIPGTLHCFTCGEKKQLFQVVSWCLDLSDDEEGKEWLIQRFGQLLSTVEEELPELSLEKEKIKVLPEFYLNKFDENNIEALNYLVNKRHIALDVVRAFQIGFNPQTRSITFPVRSMSGDLLAVFERNIDTKRFNIPPNIVKPIYLLDQVSKNNYDSIYVVESAINALTLYSWNKPAIALFGTGTTEQYEQLKKSGIRHYILCFDGDSAGRKATYRFINNMPNDVFIDVILLPEGKDVNDLTYEKFQEIEEEQLC